MGLLTQLGGHRAWAQVTTCLLSVLAPPWSCLVPREGGDWRSGKTGETTPPRGLRPHRGPLATSTRPSGLQRWFPSGVTMVPELLCSTRPPRPKPQPDPGRGAGVPCSQSRAAQPPGQGAGLAAGASLGWRPQGEWVPRLPPGEEVGLWAGEEVASDRKAHWARAGWE